jgi:hypothetical protein
MPGETGGSALCLVKARASLFTCYTEGYKGERIRVALHLELNNDFILQSFAHGSMGSIPN